MAATMKFFNVITLNSRYSLCLQNRPVTLLHMVKNITFQQSAQLSTLSKWTKQRNNKLFLKITGISAIVCSSSYIAYKWKLHSSRVSVQAASSNGPHHEPIRSIRNESDTSGLKLTLYQYQTCPFCCKARALLDYYGFSYDVVEVNSVRRSEVKWSKYRKVPILVCHGVGEEGYLQINDSSVILSLLESHIKDRSVGIEKLHSYFPELVTESKRGKKVYEFPNRYFVMYGEKLDISGTPEQRKEERKWRKWVDSWLVHTLSPNMYRTPREAIQAFRYFSEVGEWDKIFSRPERVMIMYVGAAAMYVLGKFLKKKYKLQDDVRQSLYDACDDWVKAVGKNRKFMGGDKPNLADISVYGVLSAIEGCDTFQDLLANSKINTWYYNTETAVRTHQGASVWG